MATYDLSLLTMDPTRPVVITQHVLGENSTICVRLNDLQSATGAFAGGVVEPGGP